MYLFKRHCAYHCETAHVNKPYRSLTQRTQSAGRKLTEKQKQVGKQYSNKVTVSINHVGVVLRNFLFCMKLLYIPTAFLNQCVLSETEVDTFWCKFVLFKICTGILLLTVTTMLSHPPFCFAIRLAWRHTFVSSQYLETAQSTP